MHHGRLSDDDPRRGRGKRKVDIGGLKEVGTILSFELLVKRPSPPSVNQHTITITGITTGYIYYFSTGVSPQRTHALRIF